VKSGYVGLAVIGVLNSAMSVYYYLRITVIMYMREEPAEVAPVYKSTPALVAVVISIVGTLAIGIFPSRLLEMALQSVQLLLG
jgi:NADH-quinone oxidoreductase subunit N